MKLVLAPIRLTLGLPAFYGMTIANRLQQIGRSLGIYKGPINFRVVAKPVHFGVSGKGT